MLQSLPANLMNRITTYINSVINNSNVDVSDPSLVFVISSQNYAKILDLVFLFQSFYSHIFDCTPIYLALHTAATRILNNLNMAIHIRLRALNPPT